MIEAISTTLLQRYLWLAYNSTDTAILHCCLVEELQHKRHRWQRSFNLRHFAGSFLHNVCGTFFLPTFDTDQQIQSLSLENTKGAMQVRCQCWSKSSWPISSVFGLSMSLFSGRTWSEERTSFDRLFMKKMDPLFNYQQLVEVFHQQYSHQTQWWQWMCLKETIGVSSSSNLFRRSFVIICIKSCSRSVSMYHIWRLYNIMVIDLDPHIASASFTHSTWHYPLLNTAW